MRVTLLGYGTRGDVQPMLALACGLEAAGHEVLLATNRDWSGLAERCGVPVHPIDVSPLEMSKRWEEQQSELDEGWAWFRYARKLRQGFGPLLRQLWDESVVACDGADLVLFTQLGFPGFHVAQSLDIPSIFTTAVPVGSTGAFAAPWIAAHGHSFRPIGNRITHHLNEFPWWVFRSTINAWRRELGLEPLRGLNYTSRIERQGVPRLLGYSEVVLPRPADWGPRVHVTGYWYLPDDNSFTPQPELKDTLALSASPLVLADFGAMVDHLPPGALDAVADGVEKAGARLVSVLPERIDAPSRATLVLAEAPHERLLPRVDVMIHHAGTGTTGTVLRAGCPSVPVPVLGDQYLWARCLHRLGVAATPVKGSQVTADQIAASLRIALRPAMRQRARAVARSIRAEDGVATAVELIERYELHHWATGEGLSV